jgi:hypothetical protein
LNALKEYSSVRALVSSAHRNVINERDRCVDSFSSTVIDGLHQVRDSYALILAQESSWNERWRRQVDMLRKGNI